MANVRVVIMIEIDGNFETNSSKIYDFSVGKPNSKFPSRTMLDIIEKA